MKTQIYALLDCNNFYVSCERAFNPALEKQPVVVLSNNDGCVISRSNEAKQLGIPMGAPFFKWQDFCEKHNVAVFSSNYELYGDMSHRIMTLLKKMCEDVEVYSIDEAFLLFDAENLSFLDEYLLDVRQKIKNYTSIPISIGLAQTKTLAKVANRIAKKEIDTGVFNLSDVMQQELILQRFPVKDIWGIGFRLAEHLKGLNITTAKDLRDADPKWLRAHFSVMVEKTVQELKGISCIPFETIQPRKQIISSRSFGKLVTDLSELEEAVSHYAAIACLKLRKQQCVTAGVYVFLQTNIFRAKDSQYANCATFSFPTPTADTREIIRIVKKCLQRIFRKGFKYHKAGIMLMDISPNHLRQLDMLTNTINGKSEAVMKAVDDINHTLGKDVVFYCAEGISRKWKIKTGKLSQRYTTRWNELVKVQCS